jgi:hypothetical protein
MITFTIENESNNITAHTTAQEAEALLNADRFRNEAGLAKLVADWPAARLVEIYNSLPGVSPVKKFTDRKTAASRIWKAIQSLRRALPKEASAQTEAQPDATATPVAPQTADVAPTEASTDRKTTRAIRAPKAAIQPKGTREGSKTATVLDLLKRAGGVTLKELMQATRWQPHSVRGFLSGAPSARRWDCTSRPPRARTASAATPSPSEPRHARALLPPASTPAAFLVVGRVAGPAKCAAPPTSP